MSVGYWPRNVPREVTLNAFVQAYATLGYRLCLSGALEVGVQKLALYGKGAMGSEMPMHAALQLNDGTWTSKLGTCEDVTHDAAEDAEGPEYGRVICYFSRLRPLPALF